MSLQRLVNKLKYNDFTLLYNFREEKSRGRALVLSHGVLDSIAANLTTGIFYTSFLTMYGINIVDAGILTFVPYIAQIVSLLSPYILERLPRRKWFLALTRGLYHLLFILGVTVMPNFVHDPGNRLTAFVILVLAANMINALGGQGYSVWHAKFLPDEMRSTYFTYNSMIINLGGSLIAITSALIADSLTGSPYADTIVIVLRYIGYAFALADLIVLLIPREYPYPKTGQLPKLSNVFTLPLRHKKFIKTLLVCFLYTFVANIPSGVLNYHLLNTVKISYSYTYAINFVYTFFLFGFLPFWRKKLDNNGWIRVFNWGNLLDIPALIAYAFVNAANYLWLLTSLRLYQHFFGVGRNTAYSNFIYLNLPAEDQTNYFTFNALGVNISAFLGMSLGTWFVAVMGNHSLSLFGYELTAVPLLLLGQAVLSALSWLFVHWFTPQFAPESEMQFYKKANNPNIKP